MPLSPSESLILRPRAVVLDNEAIIGAAIRIERGRIVALGDLGEDPADVPVRRLEGVIVPGPIDLQVNGAGGRGVEEGSDDALDTVARAVAAGGATAFLPTLITAPFDLLCERVAKVADWIERTRPEPAAATPLGIHVEGPFLELPGAHPAEHLVDPTVARIEALLDAARGYLSLVTLAPARAGAVEATARLSAAGVAVALGHAADPTHFTACIDAGARAVTHLFNAMSPLHHRAPGIVGHALDDERVFCAMILDGVHVDPLAARVAYRVLGPQRTILVTDAISAAGMPDGDYSLSGAPVQSEGGVARDAEGRLAGSTLTMAGAVRRFLDEMPDVSAVEVAAVCATNPAALIGHPELGTIEVGHTARLSLLQSDRSMLRIC